MPHKVDTDFNPDKKTPIAPRTPHPEEFFSGRRFNLADWQPLSFIIED